MPDSYFIVVCRADRTGRRKGPYVLATRRVFATPDEANEYAGTINASRQPLVIEGRFGQLRLPSDPQGDPDGTQ
ncbi:MAG TPA: hypothetical protein VH439_03930 [Gemmatimonadales bacterium]|jgi:hypothetical protein